MYEDIVFQEGVDLGAIQENNYQPGNLTAIGKFDFKGIKGNIYGKASTPYTTIELYAPKDWFKEKPDFGYRMRGEGIGPYRLEPDKEYYRLPDAGLYNDAFHKAADSVVAVKEMVYESMVNALKVHIPQIFEERLKISPKDQEYKLIAKENIKVKNRGQDKGLLMEEFRRHKPMEIIKKEKLQYKDISKLGEYYYKLAEIKNDPMLPYYDNDREIIKEMLSDGFTESRVCLVFMNIEDRRNIPHKNHAAIILKDPAMDKYKAKARFRQNFRKMLQQR